MMEEYKNIILKLSVIVVVSLGGWIFGKIYDQLNQNEEAIKEINVRLGKMESSFISGSRILDSFIDIAKLQEAIKQCRLK